MHELLIDIEDNVFLKIQGQKVRVTKAEYWGRDHSEFRVRLLHLENGKRVTPAHFSYGLVERDGPLFQWELKLNYPSRLMREALFAPNPLFERLAKEPKWEGAVIEIPFFKNKLQG